MPASLGCTYLICNVHVHVGSTRNIRNLSSAMNSNQSMVSMCESRRRIHETCNIRPRVFRLNQSKHDQMNGARDVVCRQSEKKYTEA